MCIVDAFPKLEGVARTGLRYDGTVLFYVMDADDPGLAVYRRAFPGVFKDLSQLSGDLKQHLRYPEDLFSIQADLGRHCPEGANSKLMHHPKVADSGERNAYREPRKERS